MTVLFVENNERYRAAIAEYLREFGISVIGTSDLKEIRNVLRADLVDVVLLDLVLDGLSAFELMEEMRREISTSQIPIVLHTALHEDWIRQRYMSQAVGDSRILQKPCSVDVIRRTLIDEVRLRREIHCAL